MFCNTCQVKFSFFTKDIGCPGCGFSCCNKCLKYKCDIPDIGRRKVCRRCNNMLNKMKSSSNDITVDNANMHKEPLAPIDITMKLDLLENPVKPPIVIYKHINYWEKLKSGLEPADQQIVDRLQKLKDEERNIPLPTVEEIKQRLTLLKDHNPEAGRSNITNIHRVDIRTNQEKVDDLIQECSMQMELPSSSNLCKDIEERLNFLQDDGGKIHFDQGMKKKNSIKLLDITSNDIELIDEISGMIIEIPSNIKDKDENKNDNEDENECRVCRQTANGSNLYKCTGCSGDLYCLSCFERSHNESEMIGKHKAIQFIKKYER